METNIISIFRRKPACKPVTVLKTLIATSLLLTSISCSDFVEVDLPSSQLNAPDVFETYNTADAALANVYASLRDQGMLTGGALGASYKLGAYTDELQFYGGATNPTSLFFSNTLTASNTEVLGWWNMAYAQVYAVNAALEGIGGSTGIQQDQKDILTGEALFLRALLHLNLTGLYGDIPYITSTDYTQNRNVTREAAGQIIQKVITDLQGAVTLLPENYSNIERIRANKACAQALLARASLYAGDWEAAAQAASTVITNPLYQLPEELQGTFLMASPATIWQLKPGISGANTPEGASYIFDAGPPSAVALSQELLNAFEPGDQRRAQWVREISNGSESWYHPYKYRQQGMTATSVEYSIALRLHEQYLIRAEALARQGTLAAARTDLNTIRALAGLPENTDNDQQQLLDAILRERRIEFFTEGTHRFTDLRRYNLLDAVLSPVKPGWDATDALMPVPATELNLNPNLEPQNPGY